MAGRPQGGRAGRRAYNAYIDEAGDEGFTRLGFRAQGVQEASTEWLVLGAVVVREEDDQKVTGLVDRLRVDLKKTQSRKPLHWRNLRNDHTKKRMAMDALAAERVALSAVAMHKPSIAARSYALKRKKGWLYNYAARFLIERLSWLAEAGKREVNLLFENRASTHYAHLNQYVKALQEDPKTRILDGTIGTVTSVPASRKGAQLADYFVSAATEALEPTLENYLEEDYLLRVRSRLYRPAGRDILSYGFKVFPKEAADVGRYPWLPEL